MIDHAEFMADEDKWPRWPVLPVKAAPFRVGMLIAGGGPTVYERNMYSFGPTAVGAPVHEYDSFEAVVADGWVVD